MAFRKEESHAASQFQEPERDTRSSFSLPKLGGSEELRDLVADYGGIDRVSKDLKIAAELLNRYMVGQLEAPYTLLLALYWQTPSGFRQGFAEAHWTHNYNSFTRKQAEAKVRYLETCLQHAAQLLEHRTDAADLVRQMLGHVPAEQGGPACGGGYGRQAHGQRLNAQGAPSIGN